MQGPVVMQIILSIAAVVALQRVFSRVRARQIGSGLAFMWILGVALFILVVWQPQIASRVSEVLGVGRGVDALLYLGMTVLFYALLRVFIRLEHQEHVITKLVSEIALLRDSHEHKDQS